MSRLADPVFVLDGLTSALAGPSQQIDLDAYASVALVLRIESESPALLWIRRTENPNDPWSGHMGFPGGRRDATDPSTRHTAERETQEETGLQLSDGRYLGSLDELQARNRSGPQPFRVVPHVYWMEAVPPLDLDAREVASAHWIPLGHFLDPSNHATHEIMIDDRPLTLPAYAFGERVIWGLSLRILNDLLGRLGPTPLGAELQG